MIGLYFLYFNFLSNGINSVFFTILTIIGGWAILTQIKHGSNIFQTLFLTTLILFFSIMFALYADSNESNDSIGNFYLLGIFIPLSLLIKPKINKLLKDYSPKDHLLNIVSGIVIAIATISFFLFLLGDIGL
ncbi:MAG: hypothetical protein UZ19_OD1000790 [Parcubacteria bacterium OLB19]|nr:MAG: hypothetical protein UZ19_OD1000790 [Parcubacteria bacterium OLB19]